MVEDLTPAQKEVIDAAEVQFQKELAWPIWEVKLEGPEVEYVPRPDPKGEFFVQEELEDGTLGNWVSKDGKPVVMPSMKIVQLQAETETQAVALAIAANPEMHTLVEARKITE
jgi:hypothetical protein